MSGSDWDSGCQPEGGPGPGIGILAARLAQSPQGDEARSPGAAVPASGGLRARDVACCRDAVPPALGPVSWNVRRTFEAFGTFDRRTDERASRVGEARVARGRRPWHRARSRPRSGPWAPLPRRRPRDAPARRTRRSQDALDAHSARPPGLAGSDPRGSDRLPQRRGAPLEPCRRRRRLAAPEALWGPDGVVSASGLLSRDASSQNPVLLDQRLPEALRLRDHNRSWTPPCTFRAFLHLLQLHSGRTVDGSVVGVPKLVQKGATGAGRALTSALRPGPLEASGPDIGRLPQPGWG